MANNFVDPNKGIPIAELLKRNKGQFTAVVEKKDWFDESAKPINKKKSDVNFEPDPTIKDEEPDAKL